MKQFCRQLVLGFCLFIYWGILASATDSEVRILSNNIAGASYGVNSLEKCFYTQILSELPVTAVSLESFLDCLVYKKQLSKLSALWILLKKSHWSWSSSNSMPQGEWQDLPGEFAVRISWSRQFQDPTQKHRIGFDFTKLKLYQNDHSRAIAFNGKTNIVLNKKFASQISNFGRFLEYLETYLFEKIVFDLRVDQLNYGSALSFESSFHRNLAYIDSPISRYWLLKEGASTHYYGTLIESSKFPANWYSQSEKLSLVPTLSITGNHHWSKLRSLLGQFDFCKWSRCLYRLEYKVLQSLFITLEHPSWIKKLHFKTHQGFGIQEGEYAQKQEALPSNLVCEAEADFESEATGWVTFDYSLTGGEIQTINHLEFGRSGLLGRVLYIESLNKSKIRFNEKVPGQYQGQNAIIREISLAAVESLKKMGGLGGAATIRSLNGFTSEAYTEEAIITEHLSGASQMIADYQRKLFRGQSVRNHKILQEAFFSETILSKGYSLLTWIQLLARNNPGAYYYLLAYDYGLRPSLDTHWKSYYDRVEWVIANDFESFELINRDTNSENSELSIKLNKN